jgi:hypothetical protein
MLLSAYTWLGDAKYRLIELAPGRYLKVCAGRPQ